MKGSSQKTGLKVVSSGKGAGVWQRRLEQELARTGNLCDSPLRADALVIVVDKSFARLMSRGIHHHDNCFEVIRDALASAKIMLPVTVDGSAVPESNSLPESIRALVGFQALALDRMSDLSGVVARLTMGAKTMSRPYVPAKIEDRRVFISYRREDSWYWASLLARAITQRMGAYNVFFDIGSIRPGRRFDAEIQSRIHNASDFVILVGSAFLAADHTGRRRLDDPNDFVRREIATAIESHKQTHIVLVSDAALPAWEQLPGEIAPAFEGAVPQQLTDYRAVDMVAAAILSRQPQPGNQSSRKLFVRTPIVFRSTSWLDPARFLTPEQKCERFIMAALPPLAELGWEPQDLVMSEGALVMTRPDVESYRFVFDFENFELILEERARSAIRLGLKHWIKRAIFSVGPDAPDIDVLRPPDQQIEAMQNPGAFVDKIGRGDVELDSQPPMRPGQIERFIRIYSQPGRRALDQQAHEHARARARGGLRVLQRIHSVSLGEKVIARAIAVSPATGCFATASDHGVYVFDTSGDSVERLGLRGNLKCLSFSKSGMLAVSDENYRLSVLDKEGTEIVSRRTPYSVWQRLKGTRGDFETLSWSVDESRIAIGASDRIWIFNLNSDEFEYVTLQQEGHIFSAAAHFLPGSEDLLVVHFSKLWSLSPETGEIHRQLDFAAGSDFYDAQSSRHLNGPAGFIPKCVALSPDGRSLAVGGNDAQLVFLDARTLQPSGMRVWHAPLVNGLQNGEVEALAFSPDGRKLASVANDDRLIVGEARSGDSLADGVLSLEPAWHGVAIKRNVCWSLDGVQLAVVEGEGRIEIWGNGVVV